MICDGEECYDYNVEKQIKRVKGYANSSNSEKNQESKCRKYIYIHGTHIDIFIHRIYLMQRSRETESRDVIARFSRGVTMHRDSRLSDLGSFFYPALNKRKPPLSELIFHDACDAPRSRVSPFARRITGDDGIFILTIVVLQQVGLRRHPRIDRPAPVIWIGWISPVLARQCHWR